MWFFFCSSWYVNHAKLIYVRLHVVSGDRCIHMKDRYRSFKVANMNNQDRSDLFTPCSPVYIHQLCTVKCPAYCTGRCLWASSGWTICRCLRFNLIDSAVSRWRSQRLSPTCALTSLEPLKLAGLKRHSFHFLSTNKDIVLAGYENVCVLSK